MNKTVTASLASLVFNIEEEAYIKLQAYIDDVKNRLKSESDVQEIINDIEQRIAELFLERISHRKEVITMLDVEEIIVIMGSPNDYGDLTEDNEETTKSFPPSNKKLYRNTEDILLGGVSSGIAHFFGWDSSWVRIGFVCLFFAFGTGALLYLSLWFLLPKAETTAEKLEMKGHTVNAQSIKDHFKNFKSEVTNLGSSTNTARFKSAGKEIFGSFSKIFGVIAIVSSALVLILLVYWLITKDFVISLTNTEANTTDISSLMDISLTTTQYNALVLGVLLFFSGPIISSFMAGIKLLFSLKQKLRMLFLFSFICWSVGLIFIIYAGISMKRDRSSEYVLTETINLNTKVENLRVEIFNDTYFSNKYRNTNDYFFELIKTENDQIILGWPKLSIIQSPSDKFELVVIKKANGRTQKEAISNAEAITYKIDANEHTLKLAPTFNFDRDKLLKKQNIEIVLRVPEGKRVILGENIERILNETPYPIEFKKRQFGGKRLTMKHNRLE